MYSQRINSILPTIVAMLAWAMLAGCAEPYQNEPIAAIDQPDAMKSVEVDLGQFDITIPNSATNSTILVDFHVFAKMPKYKTEELAPLLETHENRFRHDVMLRVRNLDRPTLNDPDLMQLREEILAAVQAILSEPKVELIGFYHFRFLED